MHAMTERAAQPDPRAEEFARARQAAEDGDLRGALAIAERLVARAPARPEGCCLQGVVARLRGDLERAREHLGRALELDPAHVASHLELARVEHKARRLDAALDHATQALNLEPQSAEAFHAMGCAYDLRDELDEAVSCLKRALELDPARIDSYTALGWIYLKQKKFQQAMDMFEGVLDMDPENLDAQHQLGFTYVRSEQYAKGVQLFSRVCERTPPSMLLARVNLANAYYHTGRWEVALRLYEQVLAQEENQFEARWNRSHILLGEHRFEEGWRDYAYRMFLDTLWTPRLFPFPPWNGEPLEGKALLVISEQGLGDQIMFGSCLPDVIGRARRVVLECEQRLCNLYRRSFPQVEVHAFVKRARGIPWLKDAGHIDCQVHMGTLPRLLRRRWSDFPRHHGYLRADPERVARWQARLAALGPGRKIGISWRGGTADTRRAMRTIPLERWLPLLRAPGCSFVSLQYGDCGAEVAAFNAQHGMQLAHWPEAIDDYDETAALCSALDLTISVCTAVIHLNGALGRPVWVLVPAVPEWRYGLRGEKLPWYPSVRLYRATAIDDWEPPIATVAAALATQRS